MVKQRVTGGGRAGKEQVAAMVSSILGLPAWPFEDAADALAVAVCAALDNALPVRATSPSLPPTMALSSRKSRSRGRDALLALARKQGKVL
jgi:hypothetical protein